MSNEEHAAPESSGQTATAPEASAPAHVEWFTKSELAAMHEEDRKAGANIVILMTSIFVAGIILYSIVDYFVSR